MGSKFPMTQLGISPRYVIYPHSAYNYKYSRRIFSEQKFPFKFVAQSLGDKWKLNDISTSTFLLLLLLMLLVVPHFLSFCLLVLVTILSLRLKENNISPNYSVLFFLYLSLILAFISIIKFPFLFQRFYPRKIECIDVEDPKFLE